MHGYYKISYSRYSFDKPDIIDSEGYEILLNSIKSDAAYTISRQNYRELQVEMSKPKGYSEEYYQNIENAAREKYKALAVPPEQLEIHAQLSTMSKRHSEQMKQMKIGLQPEDTSHKQFSLTGTLCLFAWLGVALFSWLGDLYGPGIFGLLFGICLIGGCVFTVQLLLSGISFTRFSNAEDEFYKKLNALLREGNNYVDFQKKYLAI
jgi:hypothetical protein